MTRRRLMLLASLPLTIAITLGMLAILPPRPGITKTNFDRIEKGMTRSHVEVIFAEPLAHFEHDSDLLDEAGNPLSYQTWFGPEGAARVGFSYGPDGEKVCDKQWIPRTWSETIKCWLHVP